MLRDVVFAVFNATPEEEQIEKRLPEEQIEKRLPSL
jgi:hypothetical protein